MTKSLSLNLNFDLKKLTNTKLILWLTYIFNIFDLIVTIALFQVFGTDIELNPVGVVLYDYGLLAFCKIFVIGFAMIVLNKMFKKAPHMEWMKWVIFAVYGGLTVYHIWGCNALLSAMGMI